MTDNQFPTQPEKAQLQRLYSRFIHNVKPNTLIPKLVTAGLIDQQTQQQLDLPTKTDIDKCKILFDEILFRATYKTICKFREILEDTNDDTHLQIAKRFPIRGTTQEIHCEEQPIDQSESAKSAAEPFKSKRAIPTPEIEDFYGFKSNSKPPCGRGLCVVMRNFTGDLQEYESDVTDIKHFFGDILHYEVCEGEGLVNLSYEKFESALDHIVGKLDNMFSPYDRFFLFVLSHGDEKGIKMNIQGSDFDAEEKRFKVDDIVSKFTHDKLKMLKDFPKCFYIQACRGKGVAKPAAESDPNPSSNEIVFQPNPALMAHGRDILVCYPSGYGFYSWIPPCGSLFISTCIEVFEKYYRTDHLLDMMVVVAQRVSEVNMPGEVKDAQGERRVERNVCQMPHFLSALSKKFFLHINPAK